MSKEKTKIQIDILDIWRDAKALQKRLDGLDKIRKVKTNKERAVIDSAQNSFRDFRCFNLGELLNEFGLPPEKRN